ncbi:MAG: DUF3341 domain-containing protein [Nannocystaceae bacterium]
MSSQKKRIYGLLAEYETPAEVYHACEQVRDAGYRFWDSHTPFPVHNLDKAMGLKQSPVPWLVFVGGMFGVAIGLGTQAYVSGVDYPIIYAGKPYIPWQSFVPVTFESGVLVASFCALFGMLGLNGLPRLHHPVFNSERFRRATDDRFFIAVEARDPNYGPQTRRLLESTGAASVEELER